MTDAHTEELRPNLVELGDTRADQAGGRRSNERTRHFRPDDPVGTDNGDRVGARCTRSGGDLADYVTQRSGRSAGTDRRTGRLWCPGCARGTRSPGTPRITGSPGSAGPQGATGLTGKQGAPGPAGPAGAQGAPGPTGPTGASGTIVVSTATSGTTVLSVADPPVGASVIATASCPQGEISLGGGAQVSATGLDSKNVTLRSSFPTGTNGWRAVGSVIRPLGAGEHMAVHPYVLCGKALGSQSAVPAT